MKIPYDLKNPRKTYKLPNKFREISGICPLPRRNSLAFVQDEAIRFYRFGLFSEKVTKYAKVKAGDAEDIAIFNNTAYLLEAGRRPVIYRVPDYIDGSHQYERYDLKLDAEYDPEGLCFDAKDHRLLIACKGSPVKGDTVRKVFPFDIQWGTRAESPVFTIDSRDFLDRKEGKFNPSGIAIHPVTNHVYLIGSKGVKMLICCGWDGRVKAVEKLDRDSFEQPEGIAFTKSGDLFVCSEGAKRKKGKKARIFLFAFTP